MVVTHLRRDFDGRSRGEAAKPRLSDFADSSAVERKARLALGLWDGPDERTLRVTLLKYTHGKPGATIVLNRSIGAGLVSNDGGHQEELPLSEGAT